MEWRKMMNEQQIAILTVLRAERQGMFGLDILVKDPKIKRGSLYVHLSALSDRRLVESEEVPPKDATSLPRRKYRITHEGRKQLNELPNNQHVLVQRPRPAGAF